MVRYFTILIVSFLLFGVATNAQSSKFLEMKKSDKAPRIVTGLDDKGSFYEDFKNRQLRMNRLQKSPNSLPTDLIFENYDWPSNSYQPPIAGAFDLLSDGNLYPMAVVCGNTLLNAGGTAERYTVFGFLDDFGVTTYLPYGLNASGFPRRTGWNSHMIMDKTNGIAYLAIYDFLRTPSAIRDFIWKIDLLTDPTVAVQVTTEAGALAGGWARFALDGNGTFWEVVDNSAARPLNIAASLDGGVTFQVIDSVGSNDPKFYVSDLGNDPMIMANGNKISYVNLINKSGALPGLGYLDPGTNDPDSADGFYHWYSTNGGNSWQGEMILRDGDPVIVNRPTYEPRFGSWDIGSHYVDDNGVTHVVVSGFNCLGKKGTDTIFVYPVLYWNDRDKQWLATELTDVEQANELFVRANAWGNSGAAGRPVVKTDASGKVVVAMWNRAQFSGAPGNSSVNTYTSGASPRVHYDVVYAYSTNGGVTWSAPMITDREVDKSFVYPNIAEVEVKNDTAFVHYVYLYDEIPGSFVLSQNAKSVNNVWKYNVQKFYAPIPQTVDVTFNVDMGVQAFKGLFNPATDAVKLAGNFTSWGTNPLVMTDLDGDTVYTVTQSFNPGEQLEFKFIKGADGWESVPNRTYTVPAFNSVYNAWFDNDSIYRILTPVNFKFTCDMEFEIVSGRFNPATDTLSSRGSHNGWSSSWSMVPSVGDPNKYEVTKSYSTYAGEVINYKYAYITGSGVVWENDPNKLYTVTSGDISSGAAVVPERRFNDLNLSNVTNAPCTIKFTVNMAGAISSQNGQPISPVTDVRLCGANPPLKWPAGGWPNADSALTIKMYDDGTNGDLVAGDNIWSTNVTFGQYSPLNVEYKYGANWGSTTTGGNDNESGVGANHWISMTSNMISATVENVWSVMASSTNPHPLVNIVLDVNELPGIPVVYDLAQNFPNPFNPSTSIQFSIPEAGMVSLKIFNMLGEEVATLLNEYKSAGNYNVNFNAANLTSGVYVYKINAGNFSMSKKMMLMK